MKKFNFFLCMVFIFSIIFSTHSVSAQDDLDLKDTLIKLRQNCPFIQNRKFPDLPTEEDFKQLEATLFHPDWKLPDSLKTYHLTLGNLIFGGVTFPTAHSIENEEKFRSNLLYFIREGHENGIPYNQEETWIPFANNNGTHYICMNLHTERICYFSILGVKKEKKEYQNFTTWLKEIFLPK